MVWKYDFEPVEEDVEEPPEDELVEDVELVEEEETYYERKRRELREIADRYRQLVDKSREVRLLGNELYNSIVKLRLPSIETYVHVEEDDGVFSVASHIELPQHVFEDEGVTIPMEWDYNEEFNEWTIEKLTVIPLYTHASLLREKIPIDCSRCVLRDCTRCLQGIVNIGFIVYFNKEGQYYREFYGHYYVERAEAYIITKVPLKVYEVLDHWYDSDENPFQYRGPEPGRAKDIEITPAPELVPMVAKLYVEAKKYVDELDELDEILRKIVPSRHVLDLEEDQEQTIV